MVDFNLIDQLGAGDEAAEAMLREALGASGDNRMDATVIIRRLPFAFLGLRKKSPRPFGCQAGLSPPSTDTWYTGPGSGYDRT